nr:hypothetical protein [Tanacetum cinerariifolium]
MSVDMSSLGSSVQDAEFTESSIQMDNVNAPVKKQPTPAATAEVTGTQLAETETHGQSTKEEKRRLKRFYCKPCLQKKRTNGEND